MKINQYYEAVYTTDEIIDFLLDGYEPKKVFCSDSIEVSKLEDIGFDDFSLYNPSADVPTYEYHNKKNSHWLIPDSYKNMNVYEYVYNMCVSDEEISRVEQEILLYEKYNLHDMLRCILWLVNTMDSNNIIRGVGRGSSVSSYVLYLMNVHMVDSIKYELDIKEFLKDGD